MFKHKHSYRKPDPLMLLVILVSLAVLMTSAVDAAEPIYKSMNLTDLMDGDFMVAPVGRHGAGLHMSYQTNPYQYEAPKPGPVSTQQAASTPTIFLSVRVPW